MNNLWEIEQRFERKRSKYLCGIGLLIGIVIGLAALTVFLGVKLDKVNNCDDYSVSYPGAQVEFHVWNHHVPFDATHYSTRLTVPNNATMYTVMEHAAESARHFRFSLAIFKMVIPEEGIVFGRYVESIGGITENIGEGLHWILYKMNGSPDRNRPPSTDNMTPFGIDDLRINHGDVFLFWYSKPYPTAMEKKANFQRLGPVNQSH